MGRRYRLFRAALLLLAAQMTACTFGPWNRSDADEDSDDERPEEPAYSIWALPEVMGDMYCDLVFRCCSDWDQFFASGGGTQEDCEQRTAFSFWLSVDGLDDSIDEGRLAYDGEALYRCHQSSRDFSCAELYAGGVPPHCGPEDPWFEPLVPIGGHCQRDADCIDGYCDNPTGGADGVCAQHLAIGEPCESSHECVRGFCHIDTNVCTEDPDPPTTDESGVCGFAPDIDY